ncbi:aldehyde reductase, partial [Pediococcus pentosaceus]|nr:aldehyde reductase [Pediococcus pentosaceus]
MRDVADLHIRALTVPHAGGQRFLASATGQISLPEIAALIRQKRPQIAQNIPTKTMPNLLLSSAALFNQT